MSSGDSFSRSSRRNGRLLAFTVREKSRFTVAGAARATPAGVWTEPDSGSRRRRTETVRCGDAVHLALGRLSGVQQARAAVLPPAAIVESQHFAAGWRSLICACSGVVA